MGLALRSERARPPSPPRSAAISVRRGNSLDPSSGTVLCQSAWKQCRPGEWLLAPAAALYTHTSLSFKQLAGIQQSLRLSSISRGAIVSNAKLAPMETLLRTLQ